MGRNLIEYFKKNHDGSYQIDSPGSSLLDVLSEESVRSWLLNHDRYDVVIHFAVYTDAVNKDRDGSKMLEYNLLSFMNFYKYRDYFGRMFYAGSGAEYDKRYDICSVTEEDLYDERSIPTDQYGLMKYTIGQMIEESSNIYNLRIFGLFGKYEYSNRLITYLCNKSIAGQGFSLNQDCFFDYTYIDDFCKMVALLLEKSESGLKHKTYNMVTGRRISLLQLCDIVNSIALEFGKEPQAVEVRNEGLNKEYTASNKRFLEEFPSFQYTSIDDSVRKLYSYYMDNPIKVD